MSEDAEARLTALVTEWHAKMRLGDWDVRVFLIAPDGRADRHADITINQYQRQATVRVNSDVPESDWPWTIVHELLHLVIYPTEALLRHYLARVHPGEHPALEPLHKEAVEPVLEKLVEIIIGSPQPWNRNMTRSWILTDHVESAVEMEGVV